RIGAYRILRPHRFLRPVRFLFLKFLEDVHVFFDVALAPPQAQDEEQGQPEKYGIANQHVNGCFRGGLAQEHSSSPIFIQAARCFALSCSTRSVRRSSRMRFHIKSTNTMVKVNKENRKVCNMRGVNEESPWAFGLLGPNMSG